MFEMSTAISRTRLRLGNLIRAGGVICLLYVGYWTWMQYQTYEDYSNLLDMQPPPAAKSEPKSKGKAKADAPRKPIPRGQFIGKVEVAGTEAVVLEGVDDRTLKLAVGHVPGTALPGEQGRVAFAAHRDTFFRSLRSVKLGNRITVQTPNGTFEYKIVETEIVKPDAMHVISPTKTNMLTLITCYPFNYVGKAPLRFIVHATKVPANKQLARS